MTQSGQIHEMPIRQTSFAKIKRNCSSSPLSNAGMRQAPYTAHLEPKVYTPFIEGKRAEAKALRTHLAKIGVR